MEKIEAKEICKKHIHRYVRVSMADGSVHDGFVESVDEEHLYLAVPVGHENMPYHHANTAPMGYHHDGCWNPCGGHPGYDMRAFFPGFYPPFGGYGYGFGYPRRFNRFILPLVGLTALSLLPFY